MATLISVQNHNFTAASWGTSNATAQNISSAANTTLTTSYVTSTTFTPGAITIDGIAVWVNTRLGSTGTMTVALDQAGSDVAGTVVTINVTDIPSAGNCWVFFKFAAPVLLVAATAYGVKAKTSNATQVNLFSSSGTNWSRMLRTTTLAAPAAADVLYVIGERTGAGTGNNSTVTMNNTASTIFGQINVESYGTLAYGVAAATAYLLKLAGNLNVRSGGEFDIGTTSSRMPVGSTGELFFSNSVNVDFGLNGFGSYIIRTGGAHNSEPWALLAADASAAATSLTTDRSTGWKNGDTIGIASTTRTSSQCESKALTADAVGTALTIAAIANAHSGGGVTNGPDVVAELVNITRNVKIHGTSGTLQAYISVGSAGVTDFNDTEFSFLGSNTSGQRGIDIATQTGTFLADYCSFHDFTVNGSTPLRINNASAANITISNCVAYNNTGGGNPNAGFFENTVAPTVTGISISNCVCILTTGGSSAFIFCGYNVNISNCRFAGAQGQCIYLSGGSGGTFSGIISHSNNSDGFRFSTHTGKTTFTNLTAYRNNANGLLFNAPDNIWNLTFNGVTSFGNNNNGIYNFSGLLLNIAFSGMDIRAGLVLVQPTGLTMANNIYGRAMIDNSIFGGSSQTHSSSDIEFSNQSTVTQLWLNWVKLNSSTTFKFPTVFLISDHPMYGVRCTYYQQAVNHFSQFGQGTWSYDTALFASAPASLRLTPNTASPTNLNTPRWTRSLRAGQVATVSIKVRKSFVGDGGIIYNGTAPQLMVRQNYGAGILNDTVLATSTGAASGSFETISGSTIAVTRDCVLEFFVGSINGTVGWVNVDDLIITVA